MTGGFYLSGEQISPAPYHYSSSGLEGIYLLNGYLTEEHDGERHVSIKDVEGLHKAIGRYLVTHRKALAPAEIRFLRNTMDLTQAELASCLGNNSQSVARWEKGACEIPGTAEKLLRTIFLASVMNEEEAASLRDLVLSKLRELDADDEIVPPPAQFSLLDKWMEQRRQQPREAAYA